MSRPATTRLITLGFLLFVSSPLVADDFSGDWNCKVTSPEGEHLAKLTITQDGDKVTGAFSSAARGGHKIEGSVQGDQIRFTVRYTGGEQDMVIPFQGKLQDGKISGEYKAGDTTGTWTAERAK